MRTACLAAVAAAAWLMYSSGAVAGENCALQGGVCRDACRSSEAAESGAFEDCGEKQECCVVRDAAAGMMRCCVLSFDAKNYGKQNCGLPDAGICLKGAGSPALCEQLAPCKQP